MFPLGLLLPGLTLSAAEQSWPQGPPRSPPTGAWLWGSGPALPLPRRMIVEQHAQESRYLEDVMLAMEQNVGESDYEARLEFQSTRDDIKNKAGLVGQDLGGRGSLRCLPAQPSQELAADWEGTCPVCVLARLGCQRVSMSQSLPWAGQSTSLDLGAATAPWDQSRRGPLRPGGSQGRLGGDPTESCVPPEPGGEALPARAAGGHCGGAVAVLPAGAEELHRGH